jgi:AcrR family transcriptional regulator
MNNTEIGAAARRRLHEAMLAELEAKGFERIELSRVVGSVGVPEAAFEASYESVEACVFDAYDEQTALLDSAVREACRGQGEGAPWTERVSAGLDAMLEALAARPRMARAVLCSFPSIGPRAQARAQAFTESFGPMLAGGRAAAGPEAELPREVEMLATGAVEAIVFERVAAGRAKELRAMLPALLFSVLVPFLGPERATEEMEKARRRPGGAGAATSGSRSAADGCHCEN